MSRGSLAICALVVGCLPAAGCGGGTSTTLGFHGSRSTRQSRNSGASGLIAVTRVDAGGESHIMLVDPSRRSRPRDLGPGWGASWSPDGRRLVFTYEVSTDATNTGGVGALLGRGLGGGLERLFVMNADGSGRHPLAMPWLSSAHRNMSTTKTYLHLAGTVFRDEADRLEERLSGYKVWVESRRKRPG